MLICFGPDHYPVSMDLGEPCDMDGMVDRCASFVESGTPLYLEYHPGLYLSLKTPSSLGLACEMVVNYHNFLRSYMYDEIWSGPSENLEWVHSLCDSDDCSEHLGDLDTDVAAVVHANQMFDRLQVADTKKKEAPLRVKRRSPVVQKILQSSEDLMCSDTDLHTRLPKPTPLVVMTPVPLADS